MKAFLIKNEYDQPIVRVTGLDGVNPMADLRLDKLSTDEADRTLRLFGLCRNRRWKKVPIGFESSIRPLRR